MQKIRTFFYGMGQGLKNIGRNKMFSLASIATMSACLFLFGIFYFVLENFEYMVREAETSVGVTVFFDNGISDDEIIEIGDKIKQRAEVAQIEFISAEAAWEQYKADKLSPELIETFGDDNPLENSASYVIYLNDVSMQDSLVRYLESMEGIRKVNDAEEIADSLSGFNSIIGVVSVAIIVILLAVSIFLISITISTGVSVRRQEISIMKLIGASDYFIRIPYIVEGIIIGFVGAAIPLVVLHFAYGRIIVLLEENFSSIFNIVSFLDISEITGKLIPMLLILGVGIGFIGSNMTLRRQLRKIEVN